jgi:TonB family protein
VESFFSHYRNEWFLLVVLFGVAIPGHAEKNEFDDPRTLLEASRTATDIWSEPKAPFKIEVEVEFLQMKTAGLTGKVSVVWMQPTKWRRAVMAPGYSSVDMNSDGQMSHESNWKQVKTPRRIRQLESAMSAFSMRESYSVKLPLRSRYSRMERKVHGRKLPCVREGYIESCYDPNVQNALVLRDTGFWRFEYGDFQPFQGHTFPRRFSVYEFDEKVLEGTISFAESAVENGIVWAAAKPVGAGSPKCSAGVTPGEVRSKVAPIYPSSAKVNRVQGIVVIGAVINKEGTVVEPEIMIATSPDLATAAMQAVKQWRYEPYRLCGEPVEVETEIQVRFELRG